MMNDDYMHCSSCNRWHVRDRIRCSECHHDKAEGCGCYVPDTRIFTETEYDALCEKWFTSGYKAGLKDGKEPSKVHLQPITTDSESEWIIDELIWALRVVMGDIENEEPYRAFNSWKRVALCREHEPQEPLPTWSGADSPQPRNPAELIEEASIDDHGNPNPRVIEKIIRKYAPRYTEANGYGPFDDEEQ